MKVLKTLLLTALTAGAGSAMALPVPPNQVPEPGTVPLVVLGLVAAVAVGRFFGKKK